MKWFLQAATDNESCTIREWSPSRLLKRQRIRHVQLLRPMWFAARERERRQRPAQSARVARSTITCSIPQTALDAQGGRC